MRIKIRDFYIRRSIFKWRRQRDCNARFANYAIIAALPLEAARPVSRSRL